VFEGSSKSELDIFCKVYGSDRLRAEIEGGKPLEEIVGSWEAEVQEFRERRRRHLLY
jgi:uncharacterized protein YbbC (DUF1343 family)